VSVTGAASPAPADELAELLAAAFPDDGVALPAFAPDAELLPAELEHALVAAARQSAAATGAIARMRTRFMNKLLMSLAARVMVFRLVGQER
jgi:hypothetical protein